MGVCSSIKQSQVIPERIEVSRKNKLRIDKNDKIGTADMTDSPFTDRRSPNPKLSSLLMNPNQKTSMIFRFKDDIAGQVELLRRNIMFVLGQELMNIESNNELLLKELIENEGTIYIVLGQSITDNGKMYQIRYQGVDNDDADNLKQIVTFIKYITDLYNIKIHDKLILPISIEHAVITNHKGNSFTHLYSITSVPNISLEDVRVIRKYTKRYFNENEFLYIIKQLLIILDVLLFTEQIPHFYLKAENIYLSDDLYNLKIGGFDYPLSISPLKQNQLYDIKIQRWPTLLPPELFEYHNNNTTNIECDPFKFDICSLGLIILKLYDSKAFTDEGNPKDVMLDIKDKMPTLFNLLFKMLDKDPMQRPIPSELLNELTNIKSTGVLLNPKEISMLSKETKNNEIQSNPSNLSKVAFVNYNMYEPEVALEKMSQLEKQLKESPLNKNQVDFYAEVGSLLLRARKPELSKDLLLNSLELMEPHKHSSINEYIAIKKNLGRAYASLMEYPQAIETMKMCLQLEKENQITFRKEYLYTLNDLGSIYMSLKDYKQAYIYYEEAIKLVGTITIENDTIRSTIQNNFGEVLTMLEKYDQSLELYMKSLELDTKIYGEESTQVADDHKALGNLFKRMQQFKKAFSHLKKSIQIYRLCQGSISSALASTWEDLGELYNLDGNGIKAVACFKKALTIKESLIEDNSPNLATTLHNIAVTLCDLGQYDNAIEYYERCLLIDKANLGENHPQIATSLSDIGYAYSRSGKYTESIQSYINALQIDKMNLGEGHVAVATDLHNLGLVYLDMQEYLQASDVLEQSLKIKDIKFKDNIITESSISNTLFSLGKAQIKLTNYKEAELYLERALKIDNKIEGENTFLPSMTLHQLGIIYYETGQYDKAIDYWNKCIQIRQKEQLPYDDDYGELYMYLGDVYTLKKSKNNATENYLKSINVYMELGKPKEFLDVISNKCQFNSNKQSQL